MFALEIQGKFAKIGEIRECGSLVRTRFSCLFPVTDVMVSIAVAVVCSVVADQMIEAWLQRMAGLQLDRSAVLVGYVGRLTWQKGVDVLLQAIYLQC